MIKNSILVVEDDKAIRNFISATLKVNGYECYTAINGEQAIVMSTSNKSDVILLDLGLPDMDGLDIIKNIRGWSNRPIIVVSARGDDKDKVNALDLGADDYLTKPFSVDELMARIRVAIRKLNFDNNKNSESTVFINGKLKIDYAANCVFVDNNEIHLTPIEYRLLCLFSKNVGKVLTHNYILKEIWGSFSECDMQSLRVFMATLRKKIGKSLDNTDYIQTKVGVGYRLLQIYC